MKPKLNLIIVALLAGSLAGVSMASTVSLADPQAGGIGYRYTVNMGGLDTATFSNHVGAWSWEDDSLFDPGEDPVGWTHTSNWIAVNLTVASVFTVKVERDATVPWPSAGNPARLASTNSMFPSFTLWKNWDNDLAPQAFADEFNAGAPTNDFHTYNNDGAVAWAEDLEFAASYGGVLAHYNNSTLETIERTYILPAGQYTIVIGSNASSNDTNRQGYKTTLSTNQELPVVIASNSYFTKNAIKPLAVPAAKGVLANDSGIALEDVLEIVTAPTKGSINVNQDGSFTYTPGAYFGVAGFDFFEYRLLLEGDPNTPTAKAWVSISTFAAAAGAHAGFIANEDTAEIAGLVKLDITPAGVWTSKVSYLGKHYPLRGTVGLDGDLIVIGKNPVGISLHLAAHPGPERHIHAHIHGGADHYGAHISKSPFSAANPPPSLGRHKVALAVTSSSSGAPQTGGTGSLVVSANGTAVFVGKLGDKTPFSSGAALIESNSGGPKLPVYAGVYKQPVGSVSGELIFGASAESNATGSLSVLKPTQLKPAAPGFTITYGVTTSP